MYSWVSYVYLASVLLSVVCLLLVSYQRPSKEQNIASLISIFSGLVCLGYYISIKATSIEQLIIGKKLNYVGATAVYLFIILFCIRYYKLKNLNKLIAILTSITVFFLLITGTFDMHHLYYASYTLNTSGPFLELSIEYTFLHTLYVTMTAIYSILAIAITVIEMKKKGDIKVNLINNLALLLIVLIPSVCYIVEKIIHPIINLVPFGLVIAQLNLLYLIGAGKICDVNVLVRDYVFDSIDEAIVVVDASKHFRECNKVAMEIFPELQHAVVGDTIVHASREVSKFFYQEDLKESLYINKNDKIYRSKVKEVFDRNKSGGYVLWLDDVTVQQENIHILKNYQKDLEREVDEQTAKLQHMQIQMINGFSALVENKNVVTGGHIQRTISYVDAIARELQKENLYQDTLTPKFCKTLRMVAPLHDIGKISIPDSLLDKPAKLTEEEYKIMQSHAATGAQIIDQIMSENDDREYLQLAEDVAHYHHEKWNGKGYPSGLSGNSIPLSARIMAVADVFDALVSERPYKNAFSVEEAFAIIESEAGNHFDPFIVQAFLNIREEITKLHYSIIDSPDGIGKQQSIS